MQLKKLIVCVLLSVGLLLGSGLALAQSYQYFEGISVSALAATDTIQSNSGGLRNWGGVRVGTYGVPVRITEMKVSISSSDGVGGKIKSLSIYDSTGRKISNDDWTAYLPNGRAEQKFTTNIFIQANNSKDFYVKADASGVTGSGQIYVSLSADNGPSIIGTVQRTGNQVFSYSTLALCAVTVYQNQSVSFSNPWTEAYISGTYNFNVTTDTEGSVKYWRGTRATADNYRTKIRAVRVYSDGRLIAERRISFTEAGNSVSLWSGDIVGPVGSRNETAKLKNGQSITTIEITADSDVRTPRDKVTTFSGSISTSASMSGSVDTATITILR
jgi:hypothetical protein